MRRFFLLVVVAVVASLPAQDFRSTLTGLITDPSGAAVANAKVTVTQTETNARSETLSGPAGTYTTPFLAPGTYEVVVEATGFKRFVRTGIVLGANERIGVDAVLALGSMSESVNVTAESPLLNTVTASSGQVVTTREVENLPMNGNTPLALARNALGVIPKQKHLLNEVKPFDTASGVDVSLGGANSGSNEYLLDGVPNMSSASRQGGFSPSMEAVEEVKIEMFQADAAYGDTLGGTVNIVTKSGTNHYHGSLYEFNQVSALAANLYFLNAAGTPGAITRSNQYGGTIGGPVQIPKLFNGKDKLFFFLSYEGFKDSTPGVTTTAVPTQAERNGDFSALLPLNSSSQNFTLYDPTTGTLSGTKITRVAFPNNVIPTSRLSPIAQAYMQYFPLPNQPGKADGENNYVAASPGYDNFTSWIGRADASFGSRNKLFFNLHESSYTNKTADIFKNLATGQYSTTDLWGGVLDDVHTFTPTMVLDTRLGYTRSFAVASIKSAGTLPSSLGFPTYMDTRSLDLAMPRIAFSDAFAGLSTSPGSTTPFTSVQLLGTLTKVWGRHTVKGGYDFRRYDANSLSPGFASGTFTFGTNWITNTSTSAAPTFGGSMATFLLGLPTGGQFDVNTAFAYRSYLFGYFLNDDWRIKPNLTMSVGIRFEHETPLAERYNQIVDGFNTTAVNAVSQAAAAAYAKSPISQLPVSQFSALGGLTFASPSQRSGYSTPTVFPSPRLGLSWSPGLLKNKTVFRAGFGVFNNSIGAFLTGPNTGFSQTTTLVPTNNSYLTPAATLANPYPTGILTPVGSANGVNTNLGSGISFYTADITNPYSVRWNFDVQHQFGKDMLLQIGYMGNKQVHGTLSNAISSAPLLPFLSRLPTRDAATIAALGAVVANPFAGLLPGTNLNGSTTTVATLLQAYPEFSGVTQSNSNPGWATFNALIVMFQKRFSHGLQATVNYQHSRQLASYQLNAGDPKLSYGPTSGDYPDHFVITGSAELPFGKGKRFLGGANKAVDLIAGGWMLNGVFTWESGGALSWGNVIYLGGPLNLEPRNLTQAFDVTRFDRVSADQLSQNYRTFPQMFNNLRSDAANNVDLSMIKNFHISERVTGQFRFEAFNALNRTEFAAPNLSPTSSAFGTITSQANTPRAIQMGLKLKF
jgi:hypothetical protein